MPTVLGVDSSTQACKVEVRDADTGELVAHGRAPHPSVEPPRAEQDPEAWWRALVDAVHQTRIDDVAAIAIAGQQHGMVVLDDRGVPVRPAKLWNDTEAAPDAELARRPDRRPVAWAEACGSVPVAAFTIAKLSWLHRSEPSSWDRLDKVVLPHDYLNFRLTHEYFTDRGDASGTGYWSPAENAYRWDLLEIVDSERDWKQAVPEVLSPTAHARLTASAAGELGLTSTPIVAAGTGDNMAAALGIALEPGDVAISLGTSGTVFTVAEQPTADATGAVAGFADATGRFLPLVCTLNATQVTDAFARLLDVDLAGLDTLALQSAPGAGGVTLVPYLAGERTPNRPDATGTLSGLRVGVTRQQLARAAVEGVVCGLLDGLDALAATGVPVGLGRLFVVGGGAHSGAYRQILADLAHREVTVPQGSEHVATGACIQAAAALRDVDPMEVATSWQAGRASLVTPNDATGHDEIRAAYAAARG